MSKYRLTNGSRYQEVIDALETSHQEQLEKLEQESNQSDSFAKLQLENLEQVITVLAEGNTSPDSLNDFLKLDLLERDEALFLLLGLNPKTLKSASVSKRSVSNSDDDLFDSEITEFQQYIQDSIESMAIDRAFGPNPSFNPVEVVTKNFIEWAIEKEFIELEDEYQEVKKKRPQDEYQSWQVIYNTHIALNELEDNKEKNLNKILKDKNTNFYKKLKPKLAPLYQNNPALPSPRTLKNHIEDYQRFEKRLNLK